MKLSDINRNGNEIKELIERYMMDTYERFDFIAERAEGVYLYDENGKGYLDFYGGIAVNNAGNCNEEVVQAIAEQAKDIIHTFNYPYTIPQALLAELICGELKMDKILFQNSGAEANEAMIKIARKYGVETYGAEKYHIVTAKKSFHGRTYAALSATGQPDTGCHLGFHPILPGFSYADFNDLDSFRSMCTENTIGIMVEPIQGEGGVHPGTLDFMTGLRKFCDENNILLLFDEIQTGWCRTGKIMAYEHYGVVPDILTMAKGMGGGMPISAVCTSKELARALSMGSHGSTYAGNPVCCAASYAQINFLLKHDLAANADHMGNILKEAALGLPCVREVRGVGLLIGIELEKPVAVKVKHECLEQGLLLTSIGDSIVRLTPPLTITEEDCKKAVGILKSVLQR